MRFFLILFAFTISSIAFSQSPPAPSMPKANQEILIDELISVSNYKDALMNYSKVYLWGEQYKGGKRRYENEDINTVLGNFDFEAFKKSSIYNSFSFISERKLKNLIEFYKDNDGKIDTKNNTLFISASITHNLQYQLNAEIEKLKKN
ncbi:hypothetical protein QFZ37_000264 [Chryseobacterium ginsenosidimutans]|uniref:hypothetical protein n=1 Tax=Chryseobacterium ginsenosidimutans TaxID=687846 RepID=UPI002785D980|nr:hypothetical protein [Chryseobacterium ginsenosidimutans]MDQ0591895.1 hypothetical protein [Chryseobacterium ginsenosidimutans]